MGVEDLPASVAVGLGTSVGVIENRGNGWVSFGGKVMLSLIYTYTQAARQVPMTEFT